jgi:hypothetical protein
MGVVLGKWGRGGNCNSTGQVVDEVAIGCFERDGHGAVVRVDRDTGHGAVARLAGS